MPFSTVEDVLRQGVHPHAELIPAPTPAQYNAIVDDIRQNGIIEPIKLYNGQVLDGRTRLRAAQDLGLAEVPVAFVDQNVNTKSYSISANIWRRHLTQDQIALFLNEAYVDDAGKLLPLAERKQVAEELNVKVVQNAENISNTNKIVIPASTASNARKVIEQGTPDLVEAVRAGDIGLKEAKKIASEEPELQDEVVAEVKQGTRQAEALGKVKKAKRQERDAEVAATMPTATERYQVIHGDCGKPDACGLAPASVDVIITDPPYPAEYLDCWTDLMACANYALKPGGYLIALSGQYHLPEVFARLEANKGNMQYYWQAVYSMPGGSYSPRDRQVCSAYKPLLIYTMPEAKPWIDDRGVIASEGRDTGEHEWQQSLSGFRNLIKSLNLPQGSVVLDPFAGSGTTLLAALEAGHYAIGIDTDEAAVATAIRRIATECPTASDSADEAECLHSDDSASPGAIVGNDDSDEWQDLEAELTPEPPAAELLPEPVSGDIWQEIARFTNDPKQLVKLSELIDDLEDPRAAMRCALEAHSLSNLYKLLKACR